MVYPATLQPTNGQGPVYPTGQRGSWPPSRKGMTQLTPPGGTAGGADPLSQVLSQLSPDQWKALQSQIPPQVMAQAQQALQDPRMRQQVAQFLTMAQNGQLPPEMMQQLAMATGQMGGMPMTPIPGELAGLSPFQLAKIGIVATGIGIGSGFIVSRLMNGLHDPKAPKILEPFLKIVDQLPIIGSWSRSIQRSLNGIRAPLPGQHESWALRLDGSILPKDAQKNFVASALGPKGTYHKDLKTLLATAIRPSGRIQPGAIIQRMTQAGSTAEIKQILEADPIHFLPKPVQTALENELALHSGQTGLLGGIKKLLGFRPATPLIPPKQAFNLAVVDELLAQNQFLEIVEKGVSQGRYSQKALQELSSALGSDMGAAFKSSLVQKILKNPKASEAQRVLKMLVGSRSPVTYDAIMKAIQKTPGRQTVWQILNQNSKGLLQVPLKLSQTSRWQDVVRLFDRFHVAKQIQKSKAGQELSRLLGGFMNHLDGFESYMMPQIAERNAIRTALQKKGVGPIGRGLATLGYYIQRTFNGTRHKLLGGTAIKATAPTLFSMLGRMAVSLLILGSSVTAFYKSPKESRWAKSLDMAATGIGGYVGWELGHALVSDLGLFTRIPGVSKFMFSKMFGILPFTWGGLIGSWVLPAIVGAIGSYALQKPVNWIFGNPDKIEKQLAFDKAQKEVQKNQPQSGLAQKINGLKGQQGQPGASKNAAQAAMPPNTLTPQLVGLTPEDIALNRFSRKPVGGHALSPAEEHHFEEKLWTTSGQDLW